MHKLLKISFSLILAIKLVSIGMLYTPPLATAAETVPTPVTYPSFLADAPLDSIVDRYGMDNRECVSYTAWKVQTTFHNMPDWTYRGNDGQTIPNAAAWPSLARQMNIPSGTTPQVHSVAIAQPGTPLGNNLVAGSYGHAMWVERVNSDNTVLVSQYNLHDEGEYSQMTLPASGFTYIYFGERR